MKKIIIEQFDSLSQYINVIGSRKTNKLFSDKDLSSQDTDQSDWYLTDTYDESVDLALNGYKDGLDSLTEGEIKATSRASKNIPSVDFVGYAPHVANAIAGVPMSMISSTKINVNSKVISILYSHGDSSYVSGDKFIKAGKNILNIIYSLELKGYRVALSILHYSGKDQETFTVVQVKHHRQPSNPLKIAYPLLHPSYFRRQGFRWLETHPEVEDNRFLGTYGSPLSSMYYDTNTQKDYLKKLGILKDNWYYATFKDAYRLSTDELINQMGIK